MVVGLAVVAAVAIAVPASGGGSGVLDALGLAKRANARSAVAERIARDARRRAFSAQKLSAHALRVARQVRNGRNGANGLNGPAGATGSPGSPGVPGPPGPTGGPPALAFDNVAGAFTTTSTSYVAASPAGPTVTVTVPDSGNNQGFIEVWAQATGLGDGSTEGAMGLALFDVTGGGAGTLVAGQDQLCAASFGGLPAELLVTSDTQPGVFGTPSGFLPDGCAVLGPPSPVLLSAPAGPRTFTLKYASCGCASQSTVSERNLWIAPRSTG
jgi:hypothetical protein